MRIYNVKLITVNDGVLTGQEIAETKKEAYINAVNKSFDAEHVMSVEVTEITKDEIQENIAAAEARIEVLEQQWENPMNFDVTNDFEEEINSLMEEIKDLKTYL